MFAGLTVSVQLAWWGREPFERQFRQAIRLVASAWQVLTSPVITCQAR
ncbi:hypothetical protein [Arthrobacter sp. 08Y14]|nr:hypothetical protein [Arthrobacter sp. 08Y14]